jgi:archaemetzincin
LIGGIRILLNLLPIGKVDPEILNMLQKRLSVIPVKISVLSGASIPEKSLNPKRNQYDSKHFLRLVRGYPGDKVLGITEVDLYAETLNFVFGQAEVGRKAAVISLNRLKGDRSIYHSRIVKEATHEIGHTLGLGHCKKHTCVMHYSNCLEETDLKEEKFCADCHQEMKNHLMFA